MRSRIRRGDHRYKINLPAPPSRLPPRQHPLATAVASCCLLILLLLLLLVPFLRSLSHPFSIPPDYRIACAITLLACSTVVHCTSAVSRGPHHEYSRRLSCEKRSKNFRYPRRRNLHDVACEITNFISLSSTSFSLSPATFSLPELLSMVSRRFVLRVVF